MKWITSITAKGIWGALLASQRELSDALEALRSRSSETIAKIFKSEHLAERTSGYNFSKALFDGPSCLLAWLDIQYEETWSAYIGWHRQLSEQREWMYIIYSKHVFLYVSVCVDNLKRFRGLPQGWPALSPQLMSFPAAEQTRHS